MVELGTISDFSRDETCNKSKFGPNEPKSGAKLGFCYFFKVSLLTFLDFAQDCSLGQRLTSSRGKTSIKHLWPNLGRKDIFHFNTVEHPLKLACFV